MLTGACNTMLSRFTSPGISRTADARTKPSLDRKWVFPLADCRVRSGRYKCPVMPAEYLAHFYGPGWSAARTPSRRATGLYFEALDVMLGHGTEYMSDLTAPAPTG